MESSRSEWKGYKELVKWITCAALRFTSLCPVDISGHLQPGNSIYNNIYNDQRTRISSKFYCLDCIIFIIVDEVTKKQPFQLNDGYSVLCAAFDMTNSLSAVRSEDEFPLVSMTNSNWDNDSFTFFMQQSLGKASGSLVLS